MPNTSGMRRTPDTAKSRPRQRKSVWRERSTLVEKRRTWSSMSRRYALARGEHQRINGAVVSHPLAPTAIRKHDAHAARLPTEFPAEACMDYSQREIPCGSPLMSFQFITRIQLIMTQFRASSRGACDGHGEHYDRSLRRYTRGFRRRLLASSSSSTAARSKPILWYNAKATSLSWEKASAVGEREQRAASTNGLASDVCTDQ